MPNIYDKSFLRKYLRARRLSVFAQKNSLYVWEGSNYASLAVSLSCTVNKDTINEITVVCKNKCS